MGPAVTEEEVRKAVSFQDNQHLLQLFGPGESNLRLLERELKLRVHSRGADLTLVGPLERVELAARLLRQLHGMASRGRKVSAEDYLRGIRVLQEDSTTSIKKVLGESVLVTSSGRTISPKGLAQKDYVQAFSSHDIVFGVGPAGTGKTYLAVAMAVAALQAGSVRRIIITRPAVEAGEKLGFLPGDLAEKVNPYLRPLYDALHDMIEPGKCQRFLEQGTIEVAPLAFMRGRTLGKAFIILDEAQNTTPQQMKMFLTRLGVESRVVVTGDVTQVDLPKGQGSGLMAVRRILSLILRT